MSVGISRISAPENKSPAACASKVFAGKIAYSAWSAPRPEGPKARTAPIVKQKDKGQPLAITAMHTGELNTRNTTECVMAHVLRQVL